MLGQQHAMTDSDPVHPSQIDRHLERVLSDADGVELPLAREVLQESRDRWFGRLVGTVYDSLSSRGNSDLVLSAAAGIELLRGYVRLRSRQLSNLTDKQAHSLTLNPTSALLSGSDLYAAAFSSLRSVPHIRSGDAFEILATALETITEAFARTYSLPQTADYDNAVFFDETVGTLGEAAAVFGATLAGPDELHRRYLEQFGRGISTARQIGLALDSASGGAIVVPPTLNEAQLATHAERRRDEAEQALAAFPEAVDVTRLRAFVEATEFRQNQKDPDNDVLD